MKIQGRKALFRLSTLAMLIGSWGTMVCAAEIDEERAESIAKLASPDGYVDMGLQILSGDARRIGQYYGIASPGAPLFNLLHQSRDNEDGRWIRLTGRDLGLDTREINFEHFRQGVWRYALGYGQTIRHEPLEVATGLQGVGTTAQGVSYKSIAPDAMRPVDLQMRRDQLSFAIERWEGEDSVRLRYTHEDKEGARIFGRGNFGTPAAIEFLTEPIQRNTQTLEFTLAHAGKDLQLAWGYYFTQFNNYSDRLDVTSNATNVLNPAAPALPWSPMSMPLSNDSQQMFVNGGYNLTPRTRLAFKATQTVARQNENLIEVVQPAVTPAQPAVPDAPSSLDARVVTTIGYLDLTSYEFNGVDLQANVRYEDRDDQTPVTQYLNLLAANLLSGANKPRSWRSLRVMGEAGYRLPWGFKAVGSAEHDAQERNYPEPYRRVAFRKETTEDTARLELRRTIAESATGSLAYSEARRRGSPLGDLNDTVASTVAGTVVTIRSSGDVNPLIWADRDRANWRLSFDWSPIDVLSLSLWGDKSNDVYSGRDLGPRDGQREYLSLSATYSLSRRWQTTLFASRDDTNARQFTHTGIGPAQTWAAKLRQLSDQAGVNIRGNLRSGVELGGDLTFHRDVGEQHYSALSAVTAKFNPAAVSPPDYQYKFTELRLFGSFPIDDRASVRVDYFFRDWKTDDWTWQGWTYSDGTTLAEKPEQKTHMLALSYRYRWW